MQQVIDKVKYFFLFFFMQNKGCKGISNYSTLKYINKNKKYKKEGGHKSKPSRIKEETTNQNK